jgi:hypothetical protein
MSLLNNFFDKIYCINLESREDRWESCLKQLSMKKIENVEKITPVDVRGEKPIGVNRFGEWSLIKTHINIIQKSIDCGLDKILILEDDFEICDFHPEYNKKPFEERLFDGLENLPSDWDMLFLGNSTITQNYKHVNGEIYKLGFSHCAHAVGINKNIFDIILKSLQTADEPVDIMYSRLMKDYNIYGFKPNLVSQISSYSNLTMRNENYEHLRDYI